ncbi:MAG: LamG-like jellyroll fold domain-containing protein [Candidatus Hinthialibacter antarcticus]|nr:LamG-like jellyroll fold domain-containing protein [Candidatus Hinthialibacter antarcticus]
MRQNTINLFFSLLLLCALPTQADDNVFADWQFNENGIKNTAVRDASNGHDATITGEVVIRKTEEMQSLLIDRDDTRIDVKYVKDAMPKNAITVEVWAGIEKTVEWGGLVSCFQSQGGAEQGFLLGFKQSNFHFAVSTEGTDDGNGKFSEVRALTSLEWGRWYHVVGVYDGDKQFLYVNGELVAQSDAPQGPILYPDNAPFVLGAWISNDENFRWRGWMNEVKIYSTALSQEQVQANYAKKSQQTPKVVDISVGPYLTRLDPEHVAIQWETEKPMPSIVRFGRTFPIDTQYDDIAPKTKHQVVIPNLEMEKLYYYRIYLDGERTTRLFEFDSTFDFSNPAYPLIDDPYGDDEWTVYYDGFVNRVLEEYGADVGYCLVLGSEDGRMAYEIAKRSDMQILVVDDDPKNVQASRQNLDKAGLYGVRATVSQASYDSLPYTSFFANLIVSDTAFRTGRLPFNAKETYRVLRPYGGLAVIGQVEADTIQSGELTEQKLSDWLKSTGSPEGQIHHESGVWAVIQRSALPGGGEWTHMYANGGNTACSLDLNQSNPMRVSWFGKPGPRPMVDRGTRPQGPLFANGRLFVQGDRRIFSIDAYNGTMLWTVEIPDLRRANVPRDSGNMVVNSDYVFVVVKDDCWKINAQTGALEDVLRLPKLDNNFEYEWGYLGINNGLLLGSLVKKGGTYIGADGEWYDASNHESDKVISDAIFAFDASSGETVWLHETAAAINPTICFGDNRIYWVESRSEGAKNSVAGRLPNLTLTDRYIVTLSLETGDPIWERSHEFSEGRWVFYMAYAKDTLVVVSTTDKYQIYGFDAVNGDKLWDSEYKWYRNHHGGAMQRPVIVGNTVYAEPKVFDLRSGKEYDVVMPERNKCGTITASAGALFYRDFYHGMWDIEKNIRTHFIGVRPGCWLGVIPAGGMMLAPESSAGCFCTHPIQTSMAYIPVANLNEDMR